MHRSSLTALRARHGDDTAHSDHVARIATSIFLGTAPAHGVSPLYLSALQAGALLHNVGLKEDPENHHTRGRDIVASEGLRGFTPLNLKPHELSDEHVGMIACIVAFHRKEVIASEEPLWMALPPDLQDITLRLAAIVRIADGLDYNLDQKARIVSFRGRSRPVIGVTGDAEGLEQVVQRATKKADLWDAHIGHPPRIIVAERREPWRPAVRRKDTLGESACTVLNGYLTQVAAAIPGVGSIEKVGPRHDMRIALRRIRAALRMYRNIWEPAAYEEISTELVWFGNLLGDVRDLDITVLWLEKSMTACPEAVKPGLERLRGTIARRRRWELKELITALRGPRFSELLMSLNDWVARGTGAIHILSSAERGLGAEIPGVLNRRARRILQYVGSVKESAAERQHALRRDCRRMRYTLDAWHRSLGKNRGPVLNALIAVQDALGDVHDADIRLAAWREKQRDPAVKWLRKRCQLERMKAWKGFKQTWPLLQKSLSDEILQSLARK
jgi:CHAD domain-containing protein